MPTSFLSPLAAPAHSATSTAKAADWMTRQAPGPSQGQDFGQALARSQSTQHNNRREQAALEAKSAEARRLDANRTQAHRTQQAEPSHSPKKTASPERASKQDKAQAVKDNESGNSGNPLQSKDPSSAALGVLDWLGGQVKAQTLGRVDEAQVQTSLAPAAAQRNELPPTSPALVEGIGAHALAQPGQEETGLRSTSQTWSGTEGSQSDATATKRGETRPSNADDNALVKPDSHASSGLQDLQSRESGQSVQGIHGVQDLRNPQGLNGPEASPAAATSASAQAPFQSSDSRPGAALATDAKRVLAVRTGPRVTAAPQAGLPALSQPFAGKGASSSVSSAPAASAPSAHVQAAGEGTDSGAHPGDVRGTAAFKLPAQGPAGTSEILTSLAPDAPAGAQAASESVATPGEPQLGPVWGQIEPEVGTPAWHQALSQQIMHMRQGSATEAELQLNPAGLGPLRIKLSLREQALNAEFTAAHSEVRAALEAALPQLREALQHGGVQLAQAWVESSDAQTASSGAGHHTAGRDADAGHSGRGRQGDRLSVSMLANASAARASLANLEGLGETASLRAGPGQRLNTFA